MSLRSRGAIFWLFVTAAITLFPYAIVLYSAAQQSPYVIQDDARHFVVWLRRFIDPGLYPNDIIADQLMAYTPWLYSALFWIPAKFGIDPVLFHFYFLIPLTSILFSFSVFVFVFYFWPTFFGATIVAALMPYFLRWRLGLPHDFGFTSVIVLTLAFQTRRPVFSGVLMIFVSGMLPVAGLISASAMALLMLSPERPFLIRDKRQWITFSAVIAALLIGASIALLSLGSTGPTFHASEARDIPFFGPGGRRPFWGADFTTTYLCSTVAGIVPLCRGVSGVPAILWAVFVAIFVPAMIYSIGSGLVARKLSAWRLPVLSPALARIWAAWIIAGIAWYIVAHIVAFRLHMPERFIRYTLTLALSLAFAGIFAAAVLKVTALLASKGIAGRYAAGALLAAMTLTTLWYSTRSLEARSSLTPTAAPNIEAFLQTTPKDTLVAGVIMEIDNVTTFGERSALVSMQLFIPYKKLFYMEMAERHRAVAQALYAETQDDFARLIDRYGVDYVLVERKAEEEVGALDVLAFNFPEVRATAQRIAAGGEPFFRSRLDPCVVASDGNQVLADARCLLR